MGGGGGKSSEIDLGESIIKLRVITINSRHCFDNQVQHIWQKVNRKLQALTPAIPDMYLDKENF